jgi:hypothetical protein
MGGQKPRLCSARPVHYGQRPKRRKGGQGASLAGKALAVTVPIVISVVALVVSYRAYGDQHAADQAATTSSEQQYARLVSAWVTPGHDLVIQNLATAPINDVAVDALSVLRTDGSATRYIAFRTDYIPPCESVTASIKTALVDDPFGRTVSQESVFAQFVSFIDGYGYEWLRDCLSGGLSRASPLDINPNPWPSSSLHSIEIYPASLKMSPAQGCQ